MKPGKAVPSVEAGPIGPAEAVGQGAAGGTDPAHSAAGGLAGSFPHQPVEPPAAARILVCSQQASHWFKLGGTWKAGEHCGFRYSRELCDGTLRLEDAPAPLREILSGGERFLVETEKSIDRLLTKHDRGRPWTKTCACGKTHTLEEWLALPERGHQVDEVEDLELRDCGCGSTLAVVLQSDGTRLA